MILKSVRLHPFGKTTDHTYDLSRPIAVVLGPNEHGKSTLRQAIHHVLFTPTQLTKKQAEKAVGRWLPRPGGDHAAVTLVFENDGVEWTLAKRWGAGHRSELAGGGPAIAEESAVQDRIGRMLGHNEATGRLVLSTGQAELARTLEAIKDASAAALPHVGDVMMAAAGAAGDIRQEKIKAKLTTLIEKHFSRWDRQRQSPDLDGGRDRGVQNPWKNDVGTILEAWYAWQRQLAELAELRQAERDLDTVTTHLVALETQMAEDTAFINAGRLLRDGLNERSVLEASLAPLKTSASAMADVLGRWPVAVAAIAAGEARIAEITLSVGTLETEQDAARRRDEARQTREQFDALVKAREAWGAAKDAVRTAARPADETLAELVRVSGSIKDLRNRLEAQKLTYTIVSSAPLPAVVEEGFDAERTVPVGPAAATGGARSRLKITAGPVTLTVTSGEDDVDALFDSLRRDERREKDLLRECVAESLADAQAQAKHHDTLQRAAERAQETFEAHLRGKTFETWQDEVTAIDTLPQTRGVAAIAAEIKETRGKLTAATSAHAVHWDNDRRWSETYANQESLLNALVENRASIKQKEERLTKLPTVPNGFATVQAFLEELTGREVANAGRTDRVVDLARQQQQLKDAVGERRTAELEEEVALAARAFERASREGRAYERILAVLEAIVQEGETDPLKVFEAKVTAHFREVTGGDDVLAFDDQLPCEVQRDGVVLGPDLLSQGGITALALAMRLTLAEIHFGGGRGFIVLDDPFVDLDADRRSRAVSLVRRFAERHQVVFLTCHEPHAEDFRGPRPAT